MSFDISVSGTKETIAKLTELSNSVQKRLVEAAGRAAMKPLVAAARARVPKNTGTLKKSIGVKKSKQTGPGEIVLSLGARRGFAYKDERGKKRDPFYYAIPVEYGHIVRKPKNNKVIAHIAPAGFLRSAYEQGRLQVVEDFAQELSDRIEAALS